MTRLLRILAGVIFVGAVATWVATGAHRGWTMTTVPVKKIDEVTGIEDIKYQKRFVAGVDILGAAILGAAVLTGVSFCFKTKQTKT